jgi:hypothetical protein
MGEAPTVIPPCPGESYEGPDDIEKRRAGAAPRAVVAEFEDLVFGEEPTADEPLLSLLLHIAREQEVDLAHAQAEDEGVVVLAQRGPTLRHPVSPRMEQPGLDTHGADERAGALVEDHQSGSGSLQLGEKTAEPRPCPAAGQPDFGQVDDTDQGEESFVVIGVGVADDQAIQTLNSPPPQLG